MSDDCKTVDLPAAEDTTASLNKLHKTERSENIAVARTLDGSEELLEKVHESDFPHEKPDKMAEGEKGETSAVLDKKSAKEECNESSPSIDQSEPLEGASTTEKESLLSTVADKKPRIGSAASELNHYDKMSRNQSDIFSLQEEDTVASSIFSVNGSPSRKIYRRKEMSPSNVFPFGQHYEPPSDKLPSPRDKMREGKDNYNEIKRPSSSIRNPLTGTGLSSNDEYKFKGSKRKDGNPLLGLGYSPEAAPTAHRIPPGGFSHKLW